MNDVWRIVVEAPLYVQGGGAIAVLTLMWALWQLLGRGPRLRRLRRNVRRALDRGDWAAALETLHARGRLSTSAAWQRSLDDLEAECHERALAAVLKDKQYEVAIDHALAAARLRNRDEQAVRSIVVEATLDDVRRIFAESRDTGPVHALLQRALRIQASAEAYFWQALCYLRDGKGDACVKALESARSAQTEAANKALDPSLYLGAILARAGKPKEALRYLTEANRVDARCPFVACALGSAMVAAGGDAALASRALARALGPQGFERWAKNLARAWVEGLPEGQSFVRKLAAEHSFVCPVWGADARSLRHEAWTALGHAYHRLGNYAEAKASFEKLIHETAPTYVTLRGLGLALARLAQYDEAFTHLKTAHDMEQVKDKFTCGYLALCAAKAKPAREEDKARNINWAIRLVTQFQAPGDIDWAGLLKPIFDEARNANLAITQQDQLYLCDHLAAVADTSVAAAEGYHQLMASFPAAIQPIHAWLYGRAAQQHGHEGASRLALFARIFEDPAPARAFYAKQGWDLDEVEWTYLRAAAALEPGKFPAALGADYATRGEQFLVDRSHHVEQRGDADESLLAADVLLNLAPSSGRAHDRLAQLYYRRGERDDALVVLRRWHECEQGNPTPLVRMAVLQKELGDSAGAHQSLQSALHQTSGREQADIALLGARLALDEAWSKRAEANGHVEALFGPALGYLQQCLNAAPDHPSGRSLMAAVQWMVGDNAGLAKLAASASGFTDPRQRFFAAVSNLAAGKYDEVRHLCNGPAAVQDGLDAELRYVGAWAAALQGDHAAAVDLLTKADNALEGPSDRHSRALAGRLCLLQGRAEDALSWWKALDTESQKRWRIDAALAGTVFLGAIEKLHAGEFEAAADRIREAGRLGCRDRRLGPLLVYALVKAGQRRLCESEQQ